MKQTFKPTARIEATVTKHKAINHNLVFQGNWEVVCRDKDGNVKWTDSYKNVCVDEGIDHILDVAFHGDTPTDPWYIGLLASSPSPTTSWTATEVGANDFVNYDEAALQAFVEAAASSQSVTNSASPAVFTISADSSTIGGAFLISTSTKATPAGTVFCAGAFTGGDKSADDDDTLSVTVTISAADS